MRSPTFIEIWDDKSWNHYEAELMPKRNNRYYRFRSTVRMALWIPVFTYITYFSLAAISVLQ